MDNENQRALNEEESLSAFCYTGPSILSSCYVTYLLQYQHHRVRVFVLFSGVPPLSLTRPGSRRLPTCDFYALTPIIEPTCLAKSFCVVIDRPLSVPGV
jgi:hypothetical protein